MFVEWLAKALAKLSFFTHVGKNAGNYERERESITYTHQTRGDMNLLCWLSLWLQASWAPVGE